MRAYSLGHEGEYPFLVAVQACGDDVDEVSQESFWAVHSYMIKQACREVR